MRLPSRLRRTLNIERLEDRTVPAGITGIVQNGVLYITGTPGDDTIVVRYANKTISVDGTKIEADAGRIVIDAGAGNDVIRLDSQTPIPLRVPATVLAGDGNKVIYGSNLGDIIYLGNGNNVVHGGNGRNYIRGGNGNNLIYGGNGGSIINAYGSGNNTIYGGTGNDTIYGGAGNDTIYGVGGNNYIDGGPGNDTLIGGTGNDTLMGGAGDDYIHSGNGNNLLIGGPGRDALNAGSGFNTFQDDYTPPPANATPAVVAAHIASKRTGESRYALPGDIRQQIADTCSLLASLAAFANTSPTDLAQRITYDSAHSQYLVPIFVNNQWQNVPVKFDGSWTSNEPYPGADDGTGARDYWPVIYQRAYLQSQNVDTSSTDAHQWAVRGTSASQLTAQLWRYPDVALKAVTGSLIGQDSLINDSDLATIQGAISAGRDVIANTWTVDAMRSQVDGTGLVFSHTYAVVGVTSDSQGTILTLRNPWGVDNKSTALSALSTDARSFFTQGNENDGLVQVRWDTFKQAFAAYVYEAGV
jgi:Ca2+-binding RTX toxin-like protein